MGQTILYLSIIQYLNCCRFLATMNNGSKNIHNMLSVLLGIHLGGTFLDHMVTVCLIT